MPLSVEKKQGMMKILQERSNVRTVHWHWDPMVRYAELALPFFITVVLVVDVVIACLIVWMLDAIHHPSPSVRLFLLFLILIPLLSYSFTPYPLAEEGKSSWSSKENVADCEGEWNKNRLAHYFYRPRQCKKKSTYGLKKGDRLKNEWRVNTKQ